MILITGGCGAMGSVLVRHFAQRGQRIRVLCIPNDKAVERIREFCSDIRYGDISNKKDCAGLCDGVTTVYHLAAIIISPDKTKFDTINVQGTKNIVAEAVRSSVDHFIYVSSASVVYPNPTPYSLSKRSAESIVKQSGLRFTIIRPTLVYGKQGGQEFDMYLDYLKKFPIVPFIGNGNALKRPVFVDDIIKGLIALHSNETTIGKTYNFSGGEAVSIKDFSRLCLDCMGLTKKKIAHIPVWLCFVIAFFLKFAQSKPVLSRQTICGITQDANLDPAEAQNDLGYAPVKVSLFLKNVFPRT